MMPQNGKKSFPASGFSDDIELTQACHDNNSSITMDTSTNNMSRDRISIFVVFVFILEILVLVFVSVLEYFLRATDVFPVRQVNFSCSDSFISHKKGEDTYSGFAYNADIPHEVIIGLSFTVPPFIIIVSEITLWAFGDERQKTIRALCRQCKVPQVVRRIVRYVGCFLFGILVTMIITDVTKIFAGRLRPSFLETCRPSACPAGMTFDDSVCEEEDKDVLREARLSFPSLHTSVSSFSAFFIAMYLHNVIRNPGVRVMKPFLALSFIILSVMCGLARYGRYHSHWTDVLAGFLLGFFIAAYICIFVLNKFYENYSPQELYTTLKGFLMHQRRIELKDLYKEDRLEHEHFSGLTSTTAATTSPPHSSTYNYTPDIYSNGMLIPRPHVNNNSNNNLQMGETSTDHDIRPLSPERSRAKPDGGLPYHNTFQRDLNRAVDHYRSARDIYPQPGHM